MGRSRRAVVVVLAWPLVAGAVSCGGDGNSPSDATKACAAVTAEPAARPPADLPVPADATFYQRSAVGKTSLYFAYVPGDQVRERRDAIVAQLQGAGYVIKRQDAEQNVEAEAEFEGKAHGESSVQVTRRDGCGTQLRIRYRLAA